MKRTKVSLSNQKVLQTQLGRLVPIGLQQVIPGDSFQHNTTALIRLNPLLAPVMSTLQARIHHWFVPHRLVWDDFEDFITGGPDGMDASVFPTIVPSNFAAGQFGLTGQLADYLGVTPTDVEGAVSSPEVSALPFRGYALIYNNFYRDQDLVPELPLSTESGQDNTTNVELQNVCWDKDYFSVARPFPQKGPTVTLPIGSAAPVASTGLPFNLTDGVISNRNVSAASASNTLSLRGAGLSGSADDLRFGTSTGLEADLASAMGATITEVRTAFALQRYEEARAMYGSRFVEYLRYLGVRSSDSRLQLPEYLGGGQQTVQFSEVLQTAPEDDANPVGALKGHGIGAMRSNRYRRFFEEHGYVFSFISVKPRTTYGNSMDRHWFYRTKEDFFQKELQHIGQQEIKNQEVYPYAANPQGTWGYIDRYAELRQGMNSIAGNMRTTNNIWHMARLWSDLPALNANFVKAFPTDRIFALDDLTSPPLQIMVNHSIQARRIIAPTTKPFVY